MTLPKRLRRFLPGGAAPAARRSRFCGARWVAALACGLLDASAALAHPHGRLDCQVQVDAGPEGLRAIDLRLTLDAASSASLLPRLQLAEGGPATSKEGRQFGELVAGMFRQSGWMLKLQVLGADGEPTGSALDLADPQPAGFSRTANGLVTVAVRLQPEAPAPSPHGWKLACLDPTWYWASGFAGPAQFTANPPCTAALEPMRDMAEQAQALQAAAQRAGVPGADLAAPGLLQAAGVRAPSGTVRCPAP